MASLLRDQKVPRCKDYVSRVREASSSPHGCIHKIKVILSRTPDRGLNQLSITSSATKAESLRQAPQVGDRIGVVQSELLPPNGDKRDKP